MKMKNIIRKTAITFTALLAFVSCQDDDNKFGDINTPTGLEVQQVIIGQNTTDSPNGDGSGLVTLTATAENAISYKYVYPDGTTENAPSGIVEKRFTTSGVNTYSVTVIASGKAGVSTSKTIEVTVLSVFSDPVTLEKLTGGSSKVWYWAANEAGHLGVGQNNAESEKNFYPNYYAAAPFEKAGSPTSSCLYDNKLTFSVDGGVIKYQLDNGGKTFFNAAFLSEGNGTGSEDACLDYNPGGVKIVNFSPSNSVVKANNVPGQTTGTMMTFSDKGFMGYYIGQTTYEILSITDTRMVVRAVMGGNDALAWYHTFTTQNPNSTGEDNYTNLVWSDEFETPGAPDPTKWAYELGADGWGNQELQNYTNSSENSVVAGGVLKIIAKKQNSGGAAYSSARLVTKNKYEFKYGKIEFKAKLPSGGGTWPALWMLGANYATNPWPACGEIDIMEHKGNDPNVIHGTLHYPGHSGGNGNGATTTTTNASSEFHIYSAIWSPTAIRLFVDGVQFHTVANDGSLPYNANFFLIMNVAMGGTFGGTVDPTFTQSSMEVDYVRVYQ